MQQQKKFYWKGIDQQGKTFNGYLTLNSEAELKQHLLKSGIALLRFEEQKIKNYKFFKNKVLPSELIYFFF
ncbi:hypothetical protein KAW80_02505 [Candidatus Babeliales bacterium]|nr:hypothetical protein [Candidatus Babeliales bacterium]